MDEKTFLDELNRICSMTIEEAEEYGKALCEQMNRIEKYFWEEQQEPPAQEIMPLETYQNLYLCKVGKETEADGPGEIIVRWELDHNYFLRFNTFDDFKRFTLATPAIQRTFHERIHENQQQKLRTDIDDSECVLTRDDICVIMEEIVACVYNLYQCVISPAHLLICDSCGPKKTSYHIILPGYCVANNIEAKYFAEQLRKALPERLQKYIDLQPYAKTTGLRTAYSIKKDEPDRTKKLQAGFTFEDSLITCVKDCMLLKQVAPGQPKTAKPAKNISQQHQQDIIKAIPKKYFEHFNHREFKNGLLLFDRIDASYCEFCKRVHTNDGTQMIAVHKNDLWLLCRRSKLKKHIGFVYPEKANKLPRKERRRIAEAKINEKCGVPPTQNQCKAAENYKYKNAINIHGDYMEEYPTAKDNEIIRTLFIKSGMGTGKTNALMRYIDKLPKNARILASSFRETYTIEMMRRLLLKSYKGILGEIDPHKYPRLIVQCESIGRVKSVKIGLLILDEIEAIIKQFYSKTQKDGPYAWSKFEYFIKTAERVICMDANLSQETINYIESLRGPGLLHHNETIPRTTKHQITTDRESVEQMLLELLTSGAKIVSPCTSLEQAKAIEKLAREKFPDKKIKIYHRETSSEIKAADFANVNEAWDGLDLLIYTPTALAGISFEKHHYTHAVCFWYATSADVYDCLQMLFRVRNVAEYYIHYVKEHSLKNLHETRDAILKHISMSFENAREYETPSVEVKFDADGNAIYPTTPYFESWLTFKGKRNRSQNNFLEMFINELKLIGGEVSLLQSVEEPKRKTVRKELQDIKTEIKSGDRKAVISAAELTPEEYDHMRNRDNLSPEERAAMQKYYFRSLFNDYEGDITEELLAKYSTNHVMMMYRRRKRIAQHGNPWENYKCLKRYELSGMKELEVSSIKRMLKTDRDYISLKLLDMFGVTFGSTRIFTKEEIVKIFQDNHDRLSSEKNLKFETGAFGNNPVFPEKDDKLYLHKMLKRYNGILENQYGLTLKAVNTKNQKYHLQDNFQKLFDENWNIKSHR